MFIDRWKCVTKTHQTVLLLVLKIQACRWVWIVCQEKTCREKKKAKDKTLGQIKGEGRGKKEQR